MINWSSINITSSFGQEIRNLYLTHESRTNRLSVLFPGANNTCEAPLLHYARLIALQAGSDILCIEYGYNHAGHEFTSEMYKPSLDESLKVLRLCGIEKYDSLSFISKSFGTLIAGEITRHHNPVKIRNLFLTPVGDTIPYINEYSCTVVYGTADSHFTKNDRERISKNAQLDLIELPNAGHSLEINNDYKATLGLLTKICETYYSFLNYKV